MSNDKFYTKEELTGPAPAPWKGILATVGLLCIACGAVLPILNVTIGTGTVAWWKYVYAAGALMFLAGKILNPYKGSHPRIKRLWRIESWGAIFFCVAAFFIFYYKEQMNRDVWAFTLAGAALLIFTSLAIPAAVNKEPRRSQQSKNDKSKKQ